MARFDDDLIRSDERQSPIGRPAESYDRYSRNARRPGCMTGGLIGCTAVVGAAMVFITGVGAGWWTHDQINSAIFGKGNPEPKAVVITADVMHPAQQEIYMTQDVTVEITAEQQRLQGIWRNVPGARFLDSRTRVIIRGNCKAGMDLQGDEPTYDVNIDQRAATIVIPSSQMLGCTIDPEGGITFVSGDNLLSMSDEGVRNRAVAVGLAELPKKGIEEHMPDQATQRAKEATAKRAVSFGYDPARVRVDVRPAKPKDRSPRPVASPQVVR